MKSGLATQSIVWTENNRLLDGKEPDWPIGQSQISQNSNGQKPDYQMCHYDKHQVTNLGSNH